MSLRHVVHVVRAVRAVVAATAAVVLLLAAPTAAAAQTGLSEVDRAYLVTAHQANLAGIAAGEAAYQIASTEQVRQWGQVITANNRATDADAVAAASALGVELPDSPTPEQLAGLAAVGQLSGAELDAAWTASQITANEAFIAASQQQVAEGSSPQVVAVAQRTIPVMQAHLAVLRSGGAMPTVIDSGSGGQAGKSGMASVAMTLLAGGFLAGAASLRVHRSQRRAAA